MAAGKDQPDSIAAAIAEVSESLTRLVQDEIALAKTEVIEKASSLARGAAAVAAGAVFGVFAVIFVLLTIAWGIDGALVGGVGNVWIGFVVVMGVLLILTGGAFLFAWRKLRVGPPTPKMAIDEARKIRQTVVARGAGRSPDA
ncbi:MAG: phage holin family protein [Solirubrobacteraceae bacterium]